MLKSLKHTAPKQYYSLIKSYIGQKPKSKIASAFALTDNSTGNITDFLRE